MDILIRIMQKEQIGQIRISMWHHYIGIQKYQTVIDMAVTTSLNNDSIVCVIMLMLCNQFSDLRKPMWSVLHHGSTQLVISIWHITTRPIKISKICATNF